MLVLTQQQTFTLLPSIVIQCLFSTKVNTQKNDLSPSVRQNVAPPPSRLAQFNLRRMEWPNMRTQVAVSSYICPKCNAGFRRMWDLIRHKCGQIPRYACPYCHKKDNSSSNVYRHIRRWHPKMPVGVNKMF